MSEQDRTIEVGVELQVIDCGCCGGVYAITSRRYLWCRENKRFWNCPYCRTEWGFTGKTAEQELKEKLAAVEKDRLAALARVNELSATLEKQSKRRRVKS